MTFKTFQGITYHVYDVVELVPELELVEITFDEEISTFEEPPAAEGSTSKVRVVIAFPVYVIPDNLLTALHRIAPALAALTFCIDTLV